MYEDFVPGSLIVFQFSSSLIILNCKGLYQRYNIIFNLKEPSGNSGVCRFFSSTVPINSNDYFAYDGVLAMVMLLMVTTINNIDVPDPAFGVLTIGFIH